MQDSGDLSRLVRGWEVERVREERATVQWTQEDRLKKTVTDLVDTEREYVRVSLCVSEWGRNYSMSAKLRERERERERERQRETERQRERQRNTKSSSFSLSHSNSTCW